MFKNNKKLFLLLTLTLLVFLFLEKCTPNNLTTADIFRSSKLNDAPKFGKNLSFNHYKIEPVETYLPILYDSINNMFYLTNKNGLTKIDGNGNIIISDSLVSEKKTSTQDFINYIPYIFSLKGVYDYTGNARVFHPYKAILNEDQKMANSVYKTTFDDLYKNAEMVVYDTDRLRDPSGFYPFYFLVNSEWTLLYSQEGEHRLSFENGEMDNIYGKADLQGNPSKFNNKKLIVLKDDQKSAYSVQQQVKDDTYFDTYFTEILQERKLDYQSDNRITRKSYKKLSYENVGNPFDLPDFMRATFKVKTYYELHYNNQKTYFTSETYQFEWQIEDKDDFYLFEVPKKFRNKTKVGFILYNKRDVYMIKPTK
ncbi:hypothetical protein [Soonwooa sp.]|uniref:hypothetical protein n=1 Tax=Soonwooa sp. TaxID=1938592 RepID=UPI0026232088|nr:hypothetical protein [Soonwooa sp.]